MKRLLVVLLIIGVIVSGCGTGSATEEGVPPTPTRDIVKDAADFLGVPTPDTSDLCYCVINGRYKKVDCDKCSQE